MAEKYEEIQGWNTQEVKRSRYTNYTLSVTMGSRWEGESK